VHRYLDYVFHSHTSQGNRCIKIACLNGHYEVVRILVKDHRVDHNVSDSKPLELARKGGHKKIVSLLLNVKTNTRSFKMLE
jgi:hypothetical protein